MSWRKRIADAAERIAGAGSDAPQVEARELFLRASGLDRRAFLLLDEAFKPDAGVWRRFDALVARRSAHEPLQYILGSVPFCEIELEVGPGALIPRPETEVLVERVTARLVESGWELRPPPPSRQAPSAWIVDVGTGTGAILLALLARFAGLRGLGLDLSAGALAVAARNAQRLVQEGALAAGRVALAHGRWLDSVGRGGEPIVAVVSNPPYIASRDVPALPPEIRDHEPRLALDGGEDGLDFLEPIVEGARRLLAPGGLLALELAFDQPETVARSLRGDGFELLEVYPDLSGRPRGVIARRA